VGPATLAVTGIIGLVAFHWCTIHSGEVGGAKGHLQRKTPDDSLAIWSDSHDSRSFGAQRNGGIITESRVPVNAHGAAVGYGTSLGPSIAQHGNRI